MALDDHAISIDDLMRQAVAKLKHDHVCVRCGHLKGPHMTSWCESTIPGTEIMCCDGSCIYAVEPGADAVSITDWPTATPRLNRS